MASIISFGSRLFRTRAASRDAATDLSRLDSIVAAVRDAIASATRERDGLQRRVEDGQARTASLLDRAPEYGQRRPAEEAAIREAERQLVAALGRVNQLDAHIADLEALLATLERRPVAASRTA